MNPTALQGFRGLPPDRRTSTSSTPDDREEPRTAPPLTALAIHDTRDGVVHLPERDPYSGRDLALRTLENLDEFVAWLNAKPKPNGSRSSP